MTRVPPIPFPLAWQPEPVSFSVSPEGLSAQAAARTDLFVDPFGVSSSVNAAKLLFHAPQDFLLSARITVDFVGTFDAGVLCVWQHETSWAKLCFEYSPEQEPMIVSVVTKGTSDDCNSRVVAGHSVYLRLARMGEVVAFHTSADARRWELVRVFRLEPGEMQAGFLVQAPVGEGCRVTFSELRYSPTRLKDVRSGE